MAKAKAKVEIQEATISIPLGSAPVSGYESRQSAEGRVSLGGRQTHVNAQLGPEAAQAFLRIRNGLRSTNAKLESGRPVWSSADALRWMMEQVAAS